MILTQFLHHLPWHELLRLVIESFSEGLFPFIQRIDRKQVAGVRFEGG